MGHAPWFLLIEVRLCWVFELSYREVAVFQGRVPHGSGSQRVRMWKRPILLKSGVETGTVLRLVCSIGLSVRDQRADLRRRDRESSSRWDVYQVTWRSVWKPPHFSAMNLLCFYSDISFHCGKMKQYGKLASFALKMGSFLLVTLSCVI